MIYLIFFSMKCLEAGVGSCLNNTKQPKTTSLLRKNINFNVYIFNNCLMYLICVTLLLIIKLVSVYFGNYGKLI